MKFHSYIFFVVLIFIISCTSKIPLVLNSGEIKNELHEAHTGEIVFMSEYIPFSEFKESDLLESITLTKQSDFHIRMFLENTLTHSLHELVPEFTVNELCEKGNFHFTFYVDGENIYEYNLQQGAGSCSYKNSQTVYGVPFVDVTEPDHWGRFLWMKFLHLGGGSDVLDTGSHVLKIEARTYLESDKIVIGKIIAQGEVNLIIPEEDYDKSEVLIQDVHPTEKFVISKETINENKLEELNLKIAKNQYKEISSIVVIKNGELLIEEYFNETNRETLHDTRSVGKSFASTILGIAIKENHIKSEDAVLGDFYYLSKFDNFSIEKENVSLKSLLTMSSGFEGNDSDMNSPGNEENMYPTKDWVKFTLGLPMDENNGIGKQWEYLTAGTVVLGDVLDKSVPKGLEKYADVKLFKPLGISDYKWQYTPTNVPNTAGSLQMSSLDYAKFGQLYLDGGVVNGRQVIPGSWIEKSFSHQMNIPSRTDEYYGYLFWNKKYEVNGKKYEAYYASGNGGNKILVFEELDLVIVLTVKAYNKPYAHFQADQIVEDLLGIVLGI